MVRGIRFCSTFLHVARVRKPMAMRRSHVQISVTQIIYLRPLPTERSLLCPGITNTLLCCMNVHANASGPYQPLGTYQVSQPTSPLPGQPTNLPPYGVWLRANSANTMDLAGIIKRAKESLHSQEEDLRAQYVAMKIALRAQARCIPARSLGL